MDILSVETQNGYVHLLYDKFKDTLIHDMKESEFADMYAQTLVYGLFSARCMDDTQDDFSANEAIECIPNTNPFLKNLMRECLGTQNNSMLSFDELEIGNVVELLKSTNTTSIIQDFNRQTGGGKEDPVIHFYEEFLTAYDKAQKVQRGVFYTPQPVVNFMVRAVDYILKTEFGYEDGLASTETKTIKVKRQSKTKRDGLYHMVDGTEVVPAVQVLDPATGTGTFIRQIILQIYENFKEKNKNVNDKELHDAWNEYVPEHLLPRLNAFELMMAPYAVAHMKLAMVLKDTGYEFKSNKRLQVFLTNTLEEPGNSDGQMTLFEDPLAAESIAANRVKKNNGINILIGNPPYAGESANKGPWIMSLMEEFKHEPGTRIKLKEANSKFVNDDYVKFIRYAENEIKSQSAGILCYINPHGYLDSPTFRGVRWHLLNEFDEIYVINLHGNSKKKEKTPDGSKDENVFDIQQGVCINLFVKKPSEKKRMAKVMFTDLYGLREDKYAWLLSSDISTIKWIEADIKAPEYIFNHKDNSLESEYNKGFSVRELFPLGTLGVLSKRDSLVVDFHEFDLKRKIDYFVNSNESIDEICSCFGIPTKDNDKWDAADVKRGLQKKSDLDQFYTCVHYRPFDIRSLFYEQSIIARPNYKVLSHINGHNNYALILCRQGGAANLDNWDCAFIVNSICDQNIFRRGGGTVLPLFLFEKEFGKEIKTPNISKNLFDDIMKSLVNTNVEPEEILGYIYAILYSKRYRKQYKEYLSKDFPKIPFPDTQSNFENLVLEGKELIHLHTCFMRTDHALLNSEFSGTGNNIVEKVKLNESNLYINKSQYFSHISDEVYNLTIGGNSPLQKWLKDRKGKELNLEDILTFRKIVYAVEQTVTIMERIDTLINM